MRKPRPIVYSLEEVIVTRDETTDDIKYRDPDYGETALVLGEKVHRMTDQEIIDAYNDTSQAEHARDFKYIAIEPPLGSPQIKLCDQWTPRGDVLRCLIM